MRVQLDRKGRKGLVIGNRASSCGEGAFGVLGACHGDWDKSGIADQCGDEERMVINDDVALKG